MSPRDTPFLTECCVIITGCAAIISLFYIYIYILGVFQTANYYWKNCCCVGGQILIKKKNLFHLADFIYFSRSFELLGFKHWLCWGRTLKIKCTKIKTRKHCIAQQVRASRVFTSTLTKQCLGLKLQNTKIFASSVHQGVIWKIFGS